MGTAGRQKRTAGLAKEKELGHCCDLEEKFWQRVL